MRVLSWRCPIFHHSSVCYRRARERNIPGDVAPSQATPRRPCVSSLGGRRKNQRLVSPSVECLFLEGAQSLMGLPGEDTLCYIELKNKKSGAPGCLNRLSVQLSILAQVRISRFMGLSPCQALCCQWTPIGILSPSLSAPPSQNK